ncbi:MAG TPA: BON domain-containing protein [Kofleriaceae bacterium]|nr:BON domain-containing protein [Kofleriaceae bacterium]
MSHKPARKPSSYEEIVRQTVVDPDSSVRPTLAQEKASREGFRALDKDERALEQRVVAALATSGAEISHVTAEITRDLVTLRGRVPDVSMLGVLENAVARVPGVETIHNQIVVDAGHA